MVWMNLKALKEKLEKMTHPQVICLDKAETEKLIKDLEFILDEECKRCRQENKWTHCERCYIDDMYGHT